MISQIDINNVAEANDIVEYIGRSVSLQRKGSNYVGVCPFHTEKTGSFTVSPSRQRYYCFGCHEHGDIFNFVQKHEGLSFYDAVRTLAKEKGIVIREKERTAEEIARETKHEAMYAITRRVNEWFVEQLDKNQAAKDYAFKRWGKNKFKDESGEKADYIQSTGIGYAPEGRAFIDWAKAQNINMDLLKELHLIGVNDRGQEYAQFRNRITIPIRTRANIINGWTCRDISNNKEINKYLNSSTSEIYQKENMLFGLDVARADIRSTGKVYVAEGGPDVMRMQIIGVKNAVAPLGGGDMSEKQFDLLQSCFPKTGKRILCLLPDADITKEDGTNPGTNTAIKIGKRAISRGYTVLIKNIPSMPGVKQDPDSYYDTLAKFTETAEEDFITWYANTLMCDAENVEEINRAVSEVAEMVARISDDTLKENYLKELKKIYNNGTAWKKAISTASQELKRKEVEEKAFSKESFTKYGFYEKEGGYWSLTGQTETQWSNFTMRPLFHIKDVMNPKRLYELRNKDGASEIVELKQEDLVSLSKFRQRVEGLGNYIFEANEQCLIKLKRYLYEQTETAVEISQLGWQRQGFYAFGNGAFYQGSFIKADDYGIVRLADGQNYYLPGASKIYKDDTLFQFEKRFVHHNYSTVSLRDVADSMIATFHDNAKVGICFLIATLFRDIITSTVKAFPMLNLFGPKGSGKSELGHTLMSFFIIQNIPPNLSNSTIAALSEAVAQCSNAIVHLDEFKNNIDLDKREFLKGLWDSAGRTRMNMDRDKKREQTKVDAGVIISGQEMATADIALFSRFVYLTFNKTEFTQNERNRFNELDNLRKLGFTHLTLQILNLREIFKQNFAQMFNQTVSEVMNRLGDDTCESRIINNWVTLAAAFRTVEQYLDLPFTYNDYLKITVDGIKNQNDSCKSSDELASFWQAFVAAAQGNDKKRQCIPDYDYRFDYKIQFTGDNGVGVTWMDQHALLAINPDSYYAIYQVKMKEFAQVSLNRKSLEHYLINSKQYLGKKLLRFKVGEGSSAKRALWFDYEELQKAYDLDLEVEFKELD